MFCHITQTWRGRPLTDRLAVVELIAATTTKSGLRVESALDTRSYEKGIKVTDAQGERISFLRATGRYAAKYLSALPCFLGFMAALFNSRRLAMHDWLAGTRVVRR